MPQDFGYQGIYAETGQDQALKVKTNISGSNVNRRNISKAGTINASEISERIYNFNSDKQGNTNPYQQSNMISITSDN